MNRTLIRCFGIMLMICAVQSIPAVLAVEIHIPGDYPSFAQAVAAAFDGDTIIAADGVYTGAENTGIYVYKTLQIRSAGVFYRYRWKFMAIATFSMTL